MTLNRREFLEHLAYVTGAIVLLPAVSACKKSDPPSPTPPKDTPKQGTAPAKAPTALAAIPLIKPEKWDPITYNRERGNQGAIPKSYLPSVNGATGEKDHLGKHLPYIPKIDPKLIPAGFLPIMWGDPAKGHAKHPNAPRTKENPEGHWYNWIRARKAVAGDAQELESRYSDWPKTKEGDNGAYIAFGGGDPAADSGKNTIYLVKIPDDVKKGEMIRIWAHCLTHGEYVDFLTVA
jgi:hypothetical protein